MQLLKDSQVCQRGIDAISGNIVGDPLLDATVNLCASLLGMPGSPRRPGIARTTVLKTHVAYDVAALEAATFCLPVPHFRRPVCLRATSELRSSSVIGLTATVTKCSMPC